MQFVRRLKMKLYAGYRCAWDSAAPGVFAPKQGAANKPLTGEEKCGIISPRQDKTNPVLRQRKAGGEGTEETLII